jgi:hypothetical protein
MSSAAQPLSTSEQNKQLVLRWFDEVWNQGRRETIFELFPEGSCTTELRNCRGRTNFAVFTMACAPTSLTSASAQSFPSLKVISSACTGLRSFAKRSRASP